MKKKQLRSALAIVAASAMILTGCGGNAIDTSGIDTSAPAETPAPAAETPAADTTTSSEPAEQPTETVEATGLTFAEGTTLRMACGYNNTKTGLTFDPDVAGEGITLADGNTYHAGDFKPTWVEVMNRLGFQIEDKYQGNSDAKEFEYWKEQLDQVDMVNGTAAQLQEYGEAGKIVNIAEYLDLMPNFKAYLDANQIVRLSITGATDGPNAGAIYFSPYFDGVDDIEKMPLMRVDWVQKLLDGDGEFAADKSDKTAAPVYQPYMPTSGKVDVEVVNEDGHSKSTITKDYDTAGNIIAKMNEAGSIDGVTAVNMLRTYIDEAYAGYYGTTRSNLFVGQNAAWDADELVALLRCVTANSATLNPNVGGTLEIKSKDKEGNETVTEVKLPDKVQGIFAREEKTMNRRLDLTRLAGVLFGVRGYESRNNYLYFDKSGTLHDARMEADYYNALSRMNDMTKEGLISSAFVDKQDLKVANYMENDLGFMEYDYNQTQTIYNEDGKLDAAAGEKFMAAMIPVARWDDGTGEQFMRYTESWRSVKPGGWAISKAGVGDDQDKLYAALKLIDYAYSPEGTILMSYGPDAFIKKNGDSYVTFDFNGEPWPEIADATRTELWEKANGNYTNYARQFLGSTLSFRKSQAFEYQCTTEVGREGAGYISNAIALGVIRHPSLAITSDNYWWTSVPTTLPYTATENQDIGNLTDLAAAFSTENDGNNILVNIVAGGFAEQGLTSVDACVDTVTNAYNGKNYLLTANDAWGRLEAYYNAN